MNGSKYLAKNIKLLTISQFGSKLLTIFLVPLYTNILSTVDYGNYDLITSTISLLIPILTLNISTAVLRYLLDEESQRNRILAISFKYFIASSAIVFIFLALNHIFSMVKIFKEFEVLFFLFFLVMNISTILSNYARGLDKVKELSISGIICTFFVAIFNIIFLIPLRMGIKGYLIANILGIFIQVLYLFFAVNLWTFFSPFRIKKDALEIKMLKYSKPLILNDISWWVNNASDRYIVTLLCGVSINGIYSVGYKIPTILNIFQGIFNQAWTLSAVKDFDSEDKDGFFSRMYKVYSFSMIIVCSLLICMTKVFAYFLFAKDFYNAWQYVPWLLISVVFGGLSGYVGGIFTAVKDTKIFAQSSSIGALVNIILNLILVRYMDAMGAAIATLISYWVIWVLRINKVSKYIKINISLVKDYVSFMCLIIQGSLFFFIEGKICLYILELFIFSFIIILNLDSFKLIFSKIKQMVFNKIWGK